MAKRVLPALFLAFLVFGALLAGWLQPLDNWLAARRMEVLARPPTGDFVLLDIDPESIAALGRWPWPRRTYAAITDSLVRLGAGEIAFDIDFSAPSDPAEDVAFAAALERAGGSVILAAFDQAATAGADAAPHRNRPIDALAAHAWTASVNVRLDPDGMVRRLDYAADEDGAPLPSMAAMLAGGAGASGEGFAIDFGIRANLVDRIPVIDLLDGKVTRERIAGRKVIIGASAIELRDIFSVPVYGVMSGALIQALGAESIVQDRALHPTGLSVAAAGIVLLVLLAMAGAGRGTWRRRLAGLAALAVLAEAGALAVQALLPVQVATAPWLALIAGLMLVTILREIDLRRILLAMSGTRAANSEAILDRVIADNFAGVLVIGENGRVIAASRSAGETLGIAGELAGRPVEASLPPELCAAVAGATSGAGIRPTETMVRIGSRRRVFEFVATPSRLSGGLDEEGRVRPDHTVTCLTFVDVTERKEALDRVAYLARFDPLTGLPNRNQFIEQVTAALAAAGPDEPCAMLCIDLDRFKTVNDTLGHGFGDLLLRAVGERLNRLAPAGASFARLGGDDFAIVLPGPDAAARIRDLARRLIAAATSEAYQVDGHRLVVAMSIGIATTDPGDADDPLASLKRADTALYRAKSNGGNCFAVFESAMIAGLAARQRLEMEVWEAFENGQFEVAYQPQVSLADGHVIGAEALLRWRHPERGFIPPSEFIPVIEAIGLMEPAGRFVLERACRAAAAWPEHLRIAVNVSSVQFARDDLVAVVSDTLARTGLPATRLELEITESLFMNETQALTATLAEIRAMGVGFALDDFGTGYSSLSYLRKFPIAKIKIDRSFVTGLPHDEGSVAIVRAVAAMADSLGIRLIAEGIEREEHIKFLRLLGIHEGQGYLFARPMSEADFIRMLAEEKGRARALRQAG